MKKGLAISFIAAVCAFAANASAEESKNGFYLTGKAGASVASLSDQRFQYDEGDWSTGFKGSNNHDTAFSGGIAAGYDFYPQFSIPVRTELEFYARGKADTEYNLFKDDWVRADMKNEVSVNSLMLNAYYDFRNDSAFTPWVSAGIGYARIHQKSTGVITFDNGYGYSDRASDSRSDTSDNFAWSLGAGVRYDVTPDVSLDISYRYLDAGDANVTYTDDWGDKYKSDVDVKSHDIMLGVTYNF